MPLVEKISQKFHSITTSSTTKFIAITILLLLLLIPKSMVTDVINDRKQHRDEARQEVSSHWGGPQVLAGPFLVVPYLMAERTGTGKETQTNNVLYYAIFLPDLLQEEVQAVPQVRHRGIYEVVLYQSKVSLKGSFPWPNFNDFAVQPQKILWNKAALVQGLSDIRGIQKDAVLSMEEKNIPLEPGLPPIQTVSSGIHAGLDLSTRRPSLSFSLSFTLNGAGNLSFLPLGRETTVHFTSSWPNPSFQGAFLPNERQVGPDGFKAKWEIPNLARNFPQQWNTANSPVEFHAARNNYSFMPSSEEGAEEETNKVRTMDLGPSAFGVDFFYPVDNYQTATRSAKYGELFLALTFLIFFLFEVLSGARIHAFQYLLVGFALILFYLLLLSTSEFIGFGWAYLVAAAATIGLITAYSSSVLWNGKQARLIGALLAFIYAYLYCLLKAEDYSLLLGALGLFISLAVVMYATRKVDWYHTSAPKPVKPKGKG